jgi:hypothetical protein
MIIISFTFESLADLYWQPALSFTRASGEHPNTLPSGPGKPTTKSEELEHPDLARRTVCVVAAAAAPQRQLLPGSATCPSLFRTPVLLEYDKLMDSPWDSHVLATLRGIWFSVLLILPTFTFFSQA